METTETDLGMFSMFGRTGAHKKEAHKKGPHKSTNFFSFLAFNGLSVAIVR